MCVGVSVPGSTRVPGSGAPPVRPVRSARAEFAARGRTGANPVTGSLNPSDNPRQFQPPPPATEPPPSGSGMTVPTAPPPAVPKPLPTQDTSFLGQTGDERQRRRRRSRGASAAPSLLSGVLISSANTDNSLLG